nr:hypothetical protein [Treponema sp.]
MKKLLVPMLTVLAAGTLIFSSCRGVIFDTIREEISLDDAQITGDINSIVRFTSNGKEYLYVQNGTIWMKNVDDAPTTSEPATGYNGNWTHITAPGKNIIKLAADSTYLYALSAPTYADTDDTGDNIESGRSVWYTSTPEDSTSWNKVDFGDSYGDTVSTSYNVNLFCTNTPQSAHRHAFVNIASTTVFELNGATATDITTTASYHTLSGTTLTSDTTPGTSAKSATVFGDDNVYFSSYYAMTSNETKAATATCIYYASGDDLYYYTGGTNGEQYTSDPGDSIYSMAYTNDYLLLGTAEGLVYVTLTDNDVPGSTASVSNASSTLSSYYEVW